jgi:hypothetical protein
MPGSYAEQIAFDAVVVFIVAVMLPLSVLLLRSRSNTGKMAGSALLALSVLYIGGVRPPVGRTAVHPPLPRQLTPSPSNAQFEHYRLHSPEVRHLRLRPGCVRAPQEPYARVAMQITSSGLRAALVDPTSARARALADMISGSAARK